MVILVVMLAALAFVAFRVTTPAEHVRVVTALRQGVKPLAEEADRCRIATEPFRALLRERTAWALVTPTIVTLNVVVFGLMLFGHGRLGDTATIVAWGGSLGPRTTNGEWWRLATALFVHTGILQLLATLAGLAQVGRMLERLVGPVTFACVFFASGILAGLVSLSENPLAVQAGPSGAIFGIYGLLLGVTTWGLVRRNGLMIPLMAFRSLAPTAFLFGFYCLATSGLIIRPHVIGFLVGVVSGLALARDVGVRKPEVRPLAIAMGVAAAIIINIAVPLRGLVDVGPQIEQVVAIEEPTSRAYKTAVERFRTGRLAGRALTDLIDGTIMPQLHDALMRVEALDGVLNEHQPLVADAVEYLRLRETSWRLRAEGVRTGSMRTLREADKTERASLQALERLKGRQRSLAAVTRARSAGA